MCISEILKISQTVLFDMHTRNCTDTGSCNHNRIGFLRDVVLDNFNNSSRDENNILDQIHMKQIYSDFYYDEIFITLYNNAY